MRGKITALVAAVAAAAGAASAARWARGRKADDGLELEVSRSVPPPADGPAPSESASAEPVPSPAEAEASDDLTAIKGLGKVKAAKLVAAGVTSYAQIADWSDDDIAEMGLTCNTSPGQIKREDWVGQAKALAEA
jgi:large subunit ribosomal protein L21